MSQLKWTPEAIAPAQAVLAAGGTMAAAAREIDVPYHVIFRLIDEGRLKKPGRKARGLEEPEEPDWGAGIRAHVAAQRKCLSCLQLFASSWSGNRICDSCREAMGYPAM